MDAAIVAGVIVCKSHWFKRRLNIFKAHRNSSGGDGQLSEVLKPSARRLGTDSGRTRRSQVQTRGYAHTMGTPGCQAAAMDLKILLELSMNPELQRALKRHTQWFGSYKASGELKKLQVWLIVSDGQMEFLTRGDAYKVKRVRRNPRVICYVGSKDGPAISGTAEIITDRSEVARVYRKYWKAHPVRMVIVIGLVIWVEILLNQRVVVRVQPDDPNPLAGLSDPAI